MRGWVAGLLLQAKSCTGLRFGWLCSAQSQLWPAFSTKLCRFGHWNSAGFWRWTISRSPGGWAQEQSSNKDDQANSCKDSAQNWENFKYKKQQTVNVIEGPGLGYISKNLNANPVILITFVIFVLHSRIILIEYVSDNFTMNILIFKPKLSVIPQPIANCVFWNIYPQFPPFFYNDVCILNKYFVFNFHIRSLTCVKI